MRRWLWGVSLLALVGCTAELSGSQAGPSGDGDGSAPSGPGSSGDGDGAGAGASGDGDGDAAPPDPGQPSDGPYQASASLARRLTRAELDNSLRDLFGDTRGAASALLPEDPYAPYDNAYLGQRASGALIDSLSAMAEDVATRVVADPAMHARLVPCTPASPGDADCFREVVEGLTRRAFRRPVDTAEVERYLSLLDYATEEIADVDNGFDTAVRLLVEAVLIDPEFLYRIEVGSPTGEEGLFALSDHEIATRLSFLLWGTTPDAMLLADAEAGRLRDPDGRLQAARRLLGDARARTQLQRFHAMWLGYRVVPHSADLAAAFQRETSALIDRVVFDEPQAYTSLFTFPETYIDDQLAAHYDLPLPGQETWVSYGDSGRAGLLAHGSFLSAFGKFSDTSPTQRGILVRERLLCQDIPPPPPTVMADQPPTSDDAVCKYDRYEAHRSSASCAGCHAQMDPIGFGLENYDLAGRFREHDDGQPDCMIEGLGEVPPYGSFSGPGELGDLLIASGELERCVVSQFITFALGREPEGNEDGEIDRLTEAMTGTGGELVQMIEALVVSEAFAQRLEPRP